VISLAGSGDRRVSQSVSELGRVFGGRGGVGPAGRRFPDQEAGFRLLQPPSVALFAPMVMTAERCDITFARDAARVPGGGVIQVAPGGRSRARYIARCGR
jgi:hypothetical protein